MPSLADINISEIQEIWHFTFTIDLVAADGHTFQYFGPSLATVFGQDFTGETLAQAMENDPMLANTIGFYEKVMETREPAMEAASFYLEGQEVRYRSIIVPLSGDGGETVDYLLGTTNYKMFSGT